MPIQRLILAKQNGNNGIEYKFLNYNSRSIRSFEMGNCRYIMAYTKLSCIDFNVAADHSHPYASWILELIFCMPHSGQSVFNNKHCYIKLTRALLSYKRVKARAGWRNYPCCRNYLWNFIVGAARKFYNILIMSG